MMNLIMQLPLIVISMAEMKPKAIWIGKALDFITPSLFLFGI